MSHGQNCCRICRPSSRHLVPLVPEQSRALACLLLPPLAGTATPAQRARPRVLGAPGHGAPWACCAAQCPHRALYAAACRTPLPCVQWPKVLNAPLSEVDPELLDIIEHEKNRQYKGLELIPSENFVSASVMEAVGSGERAVDGAARHGVGRHPRACGLLVACRRVPACVPGARKTHGGARSARGGTRPRLQAVGPAPPPCCRTLDAG